MQQLGAGHSSPFCSVEGLFVPRTSPSQLSLFPLAALKFRLVNNNRVVGVTSIPAFCAGCEFVEWLKKCLDNARASGRSGSHFKKVLKYHHRSFAPSFSSRATKAAIYLLRLRTLESVKITS